MNNKCYCAAEEVLATLDNNPLFGNGDTEDIETLPLDDVKARLNQLGVSDKMCGELEALIGEPESSMVVCLLESLNSDELLTFENIERLPITVVNSRLQTLGINYRAGLTEIANFIGRVSPGTHSGERHRISSENSAGPPKPATGHSRILILIPAIAAVIALLWLGVIVRRDQGKIAEQRHEIEQLNRAMLQLQLDSQALAKIAPSSEGIVTIPSEGAVEEVGKGLLMGVVPHRSGNAIKR